VALFFFPWTGKRRLESTTYQLRLIQPSKGTHRKSNRPGLTQSSTAVDFKLIANWFEWGLTAVDSTNKCTHQELNQWPKLTTLWDDSSSNQNSLDISDAVALLHKLCHGKLLCEITKWPWHPH
jgi:hypothetical protein